MKEKKDIYQETTDNLIKMIEDGCPPWRPKWMSKGSQCLPIRNNREPYKGSNILLLWTSQLLNGFTSNQWFTFNQAIQLGGKVKKGSKGSKILYFSTVKKIEEVESVEMEKTIPFAKIYTVFNLDQVEGIGQEPLPQRELSLAEVEKQYSKIPCAVQHHGCRAFYSMKDDIITLPPLDNFIDDESYISTRMHETIHWTGNSKRLKRDMSGDFKSPQYAFEELVAELGASFLCARFGILTQTREDHASYLASWLSKMKQDSKYIFKAAAAAQKAVEFLDGYIAKEL